MKRRQEMFDKMLAGLRKQRKPSLAKFAPDLPPLCAYRGAGDTSCAIGFLIPDEAYDPLMDHEAWPIRELLKQDVIEGAKPDDFSFLYDCQTTLHDSAESEARSTGADFLELVEAGAQSVARRFNLRYEAPETV